MSAQTTGDNGPNPVNMYRLPWTLGDNAMTWLEPTRYCNITCDACFIQNDRSSAKSLAVIESELDTMLELRACDAILIAGGEPLTHPDIAEIVALVKSRGVKAVLITNGVGLDQQLARELKKAGAFGFTFHVDSHQSRPGWNNKNERELNPLRQELADIIYEVGGLSCAFNTTIFPDSLIYVPDILKWAVASAERVQVMTFICVRTGEIDDQFEYLANGKRVEIRDMPYSSKNSYENLMTVDIYNEIKKVLPDLEFCAYLGGSAIPHSLKWVIGTHFVFNGRSIGHLGKKAMEFIQGFHHLLKGRYLAYTKPAISRLGKSTLLMSLFDPEIRRALRVYSGIIAKNPARLLKPLVIQNVSVVQPVDILENGEQDSCDGCPNKTLWNNQLVSACRLEEYRQYGGPILTVNKSESPDNKRGEQLNLRYD